MNNRDVNAMKQGWARVVWALVGCAVLVCGIGLGVGNEVRAESKAHGLVVLTAGDALKTHWREGKAKDDWMVVGGVKVHPDDEKKLKAVDGTGVIVNGVNGRTRNLITKKEHRDVHAEIEFMVPKGSNSGVYFMGRYEVQVLDSYGKDKLYFGDCGGIYARWDSARGKGNERFDGRPPSVNAAKAPGEWQKFEVWFRAPRFNEKGDKIADARFVKVIHNGKVIHEDVAISGPTRAGIANDERAEGPLMLQGDHGPVAYRNIRVRDVDLTDKGSEKFAGRTVDEWVVRLGHENRFIRLQAANTLSNIGPGGLPALRGVLGDKDPAMVYWACHGFAHANREVREATPELVELLKSENPDVKMMAAYALRYTKHHEQGLDVLIEMTKVTRQGFANVAADYLGFIGVRAKRAEEALKELAKERDYHLKNAANRALGRIE